MAVNQSTDSMVSIITPVYSCEAYIKKTIESVLAQTYKNWEMLLVDDCTPDNSAHIIMQYREQDPRIKYIKLVQNSGAAMARNAALAEAKGRYIAYLDADDIWLPDKLSRQLDFMEKTGAMFTCCDYEKIDSNGASLNKIIHMPKTMTYEQYLCNTIIQTVGVMIDTAKVDRALLIMPNVRRGQDAGTWMQILRGGIVFMGQNEVLAQYRRVPNSLSSNKFYAMKRTWYLYRGVEKLPLLKSVRCMIGWAWHASLKRIYFRKGSARCQKQ